MSCPPPDCVIQLPSGEPGAKNAGMPLETLCQNIEMLAFSQAFAASEFWNPVVETTHLVALALLVGSISTFDLRLLGIGKKRVPISVLGQRLLPATWAGFGIALFTGSILFASAATTYCYNPAFRIKLLVIALAGVNMVVFHATTYRRVAAWEENPETPLHSKFAGALSILCWVAVIVAGRWIAFIE